MAKKPGTVLRKDGDPEGAFKKAAKVIERTYSAPFLAHNTMEPVNCFAHVTADKAEIYGPIQIPEFVMSALTTRLGMPKEKIHIRLARMGGGFGLTVLRPSFGGGSGHFAKNECPGQAGVHPGR